jgi:SAM-dependent methyltransferase
MQDENFASTNCEDYWDKPESVAKYSAEPFLYRGERSALSSCFPDGLEGRRVLDLACGAGRTTYFLHKMGADVVGVDISQNLIHAAREHFPDIDFRRGDAEFLDFADASFDVVLFSYNSLDYLYPKEKRINSIREIWRVLSPDGRFIFSHHNFGALFFGWYKTMRPAKLLYRAKHIFNGNAFRKECFLPEYEFPDMKTYYAWSQQVTADLQELGFELIHVYANDPVLVALQRTLRTTWFTKLADPWPYYIFRKPSPKQRWNDDRRKTTDSMNLYETPAGGLGEQPQRRKVAP